MIINLHVNSRSLTRILILTVQSARARVLESDRLIKNKVETMLAAFAHFQCCKDELLIPNNEGQCVRPRLSIWAKGYICDVHILSNCDKKQQPSIRIKHVENHLSCIHRGTCGPVGVCSISKSVGFFGETVRPQKAISEMSPIFQYLTTK